MGIVKVSSIHATSGGDAVACDAQIHCIVG